MDEDLELRLRFVRDVLGTSIVRQHEVAKKFYEVLNRVPGEWNELCFGLAMSARTHLWIDVARQFGPDAVPEVAGPYCAAFRTQLDRPPVEDPTGPIMPWLQLLAAIERDAKPGLLRRVFGARG